MSLDFATEFVNNIVLSLPLWDSASRLHWMSMLMFMVCFVGWYAYKSATEPSFYWKVNLEVMNLDLQLMLVNLLFKSLLGSVVVVATWSMAHQTVGILDSIVGGNVARLPEYVAVSVVSVVYFVVDDASRFLLHRLLHKIPLLWQFHQVHHSAEQLTPLTFYRVHPVETILYQLRSVLTMGALAGVVFWLFRESVGPWEWMGVPAISFALNTLFGNLRHSPISLAYPACVEGWLISPKQHQFHHQHQGTGSNFGTWLAIWDRWTGSLCLSTDMVLGSEGLKMSNHQQSLQSVLLDPCNASLALLRKKQKVLFATMLVVMIGFVFPRIGWAEENKDSTTDEDEKDESTTAGEMESNGQIIVYGQNHHIEEAGSAHQVNAETLELLECNDIQQIAVMIPGVQVRTEDGFGLRPNIGIRGANSDRSAKVTLMEDGVLFAPAPYAAPAAYFFPMSTRFTGVEVFKGAASTRYGPQTVAGAFNVLTRSIPHTKQQVFDASYGAFGTLKAHGHVGNQWRNGWGILAEIAHVQSDGFKVLASGNSTGFSRTESMLKLGRSSVQHKWIAKLGYSREKSHETYLGLSQMDFLDNPLLRYPATEEGLMQWHRTQAELMWRYAPSNRTQLQTTVYHHYLDRSWRKFNGFSGNIDLHDLLQQDPTSGTGAVYLAILRGERDAVQPEEYLQIGQNDRRFHSFGIQSVGKYARYGQVSHQLEYGLRLHGDVVSREHSMDNAMMIDAILEMVPNSHELQLDTTVGAFALATYVHDNIQFANLHWIPSLRNEWIHTTTDFSDSLFEQQNIWLPGMGFLWEKDDWNQLFLSIHQGFSPVSPEQASHALPEKSWNYEVGVRQSMDDIRWDITGFVNDYTRIAGQCTLSSGCGIEEVGQQFLAGAARISGVESSVFRQFLLENAWKFSVQGQYTYTHALFIEDFYSSFPQFGQVENGDTLPYVARHQANVLTSLDADAYTLTVSYVHRGKMLDEAKAWREHSSEDIPKMDTVDLHAQYTLPRPFRQSPWILYGSVTNLTNVQTVASWRPFGARPLAPRMWMLGVKKQL